MFRTTPIVIDMCLIFIRKQIVAENGMKIWISVPFKFQMQIILLASLPGKQSFGQVFFS